MSLILSIHPQTPQARSIHKAGDFLLQGKVVAAPWGGQSVLLGLPSSVKAIESLLPVNKKQQGGHWLLLGAGLSDLSAYVRIDNAIFARLKPHVPSDKYCFMVPPAARMAKYLHNKALDKIAICCPSSPCYTALLAATDSPILAYCQRPVALPPEDDADGQLDIERCAVACRLEVVSFNDDKEREAPPSVIDLTAVPPAVCIVGAGDTADFSV